SGRGTQVVAVTPRTALRNSREPDYCSKGCRWGHTLQPPKGVAEGAPFGDTLARPILWASRNKRTATPAAPAYRKAKPQSSPRRRRGPIPTVGRSSASAGVYGFPLARERHASNDLAHLVEVEPRQPLKNLAWIAVAEVAQEIRLHPAIGKERRVHLGV